MAGNYVDVPAPRMAWDVDGSILVATDTNRLNPIILGLSSRQAANDESVGTNDGPAYYGWDGRLTVIFPQLRDVLGYVAMVRNTLYGFNTSVDTTNGSDGTWVSRGAGVQASNTKTALRQDIQTVSWLGVKAVEFYVYQFNGNPALITGHLFGNITAGQTPDRVEIWDPSSDVVLPPAALDWGDVPQGSSADKTFRVKNLSASMTANTITLSTSALTDASPSVPAQHVISYDGGPFAATAVIPTLAPGAISNLCTIRRITPSDAALSLWWARVNATVTSWT